MIEREILQTKEFMQRFLTTDTWDDWLLTEAVLSCAATWTIDGHVNAAYFKEDSGEDDAPEGSFLPWSAYRQTVLSLIRGKRTPLSFRFLLQPPESGVPGIPDSSATDAFDRICRIRFAEGRVYVTSALSVKQFSMDKEPEHEWDQALSAFLDSTGIRFETL